MGFRKVLLGSTTTTTVEVVAAVSVDDMMWSIEDRGVEEFG